MADEIRADIELLADPAQSDDSRPSVGATVAVASTISARRSDGVLRIRCRRVLDDIPAKLLSV
ncbi:hypothetical protein [Streptomyces atratus]|uniref:hypothetical protein n=1 Tax=Streptomyces atratus TaxID=1893 RepID=UPI001300A82A|nr:hypothetical protein [Streptomyces atratus]